MRLSKNELVFFSSAALIVCVFAILFYFDFTSRSAIGQERIVGSIAFKKHVAQRKYSDQVVWDEIEQTAPVYNNDTIRTADRSEAVVRLADGTEITVNENSMIQLSFATDEIDIQFNGGSISTRRGDISAKTANRLNIKTGDTTVNVTRSDVQLSAEKDKGVSMVVTRGDATVTAGGKEQSIKENQKVVVQKGSREVRIYALPLKPLQPLPDTVIVTPSGTGTIAFTWETIKPEQDGILEISDSNSFGRTVANRKLQQNTVSATLPAGTYFWRIRAKNRLNGAVDTSEARKFSLVRVEPPHLISPEQGRVVQYGRSRPVIRYSWKGGDTLQEYLLEIASDRAMGNLVGTYKTPESAIAVDTLKEGTYFWRVLSTITISGKTTSVPSAIRMIRITRKIIIDPPSPQFPTDGGTVSGAVLKDKGIIFSWLNDQDIQAARLTVSTVPDFSKIVFSGISETNFMKIHQKLEPGTYFWRVQGILAGNRSTDPSASMKFTVVAVQRIALTSPPDGSEIVIAGSGRDVTLSWEKTDIYGEYLVQVSSKRDFSQITKEDNVTVNHAVIYGVNPGTHYWRVLLKNNEGSIVMMSLPATFIVPDTLPEPSIVSPGNRETIDMDRLNELDLKWKRIGEANAYQFRLYRVDNNKITLITDRMIRGTNYGLDDIDFPGEGEYRWSVQALEMNQAGSKIIRKSPVSRSSFNIQAVTAPKKIKIITPRVIYME